MKKLLLILLCFVGVQARAQFIVNPYSFGGAAATGGIVSIDGNDKIHTFNSSGTLTVTSGGVFQVLIVAGGGKGGATASASHWSGGGGGGGVLLCNTYLSPGSYTVTVGSGGTVATPNGGNSSLASLVAVGGGKGGDSGSGSTTGGSGGGGFAWVSGNSAGSASTQSGATDCTPYGNSGANGQTNVISGGGGGAGGAASGSTGGAGLSSAISGSTVSYGVGGGGATSGTAPLDGSANTGNGGRGSGTSGVVGGDGGSGVVIVRYYATDLSFSNFVLDNMPSAAAAYGLRRLSTTYAGSAIRVERTSDNTETDIGFDASGNLDTTALKTFVGSGTARIATWYDQSGSERNITQATLASRPTIVSSGTIQRIGGKPAALLNGSSHFLATTTLISNPGNNGTVTQSIVFQKNTSGEGSLIAQGQTSSYFSFGLYIKPATILFRNTSNDFQIGTTSISINTLTVYNAVSSGASTTGRKGGVSQGSTANGTASGTTGSLTLGRRNGDNSEYYPGFVSEVIIWGSALNSTQIQNVENNQIAYFQ